MHSPNEGSSSIFDRLGIQRLGRFRGKTISYDTEGCRTSDLATNILASFERQEEILIRCGNAVVISTEEVVSLAPAGPNDVDFLNGVKRIMVYDLTENFRREKTERRFYLRTAENGFVIRRVRWEDASPDEFSH